MHLTRQQWQLEDPAETLSDIGRLHPFVAGRVVVAAVDLELHVMVAAIPVPDDPSRRWDLLEASELLRQVAVELAPAGQGGDGDGGVVRHALVTVVCRRGRLSESAVEDRWAEAWLFADHALEAAIGDVYAVTPSGWRGVMDHRTGDEPRLRPRLSLVQPPDA